MAEEKEAKKLLIKKKAPLAKKKKLWFQILAPDIFGKAVIGESLVEDVKGLLGKKIRLSLMTLTGDMKKQHISVLFLVDKIADNKGMTKIVGYEVAPASIKRQVRRGRNRVDASFVCQTKNSIKVRVKPFLLTAFETHRSKVGAIRRIITAYIATYAANYDYDAFFRDIVSGKLQSRVREAVQHIYPIRSSEIRMLQVVKENTPVTALPQANLNLEQPMHSKEKEQPAATEAPAQEAVSA